jgi:hypothetical protein
MSKEGGGRERARKKEAEGGRGHRRRGSVFRKTGMSGG